MELTSLLVNGFSNYKFKEIDTTLMINICAENVTCRRVNQDRNGLFIRLAREAGKEIKEIEDVLYTIGTRVISTFNQKTLSPTPFWHSYDRGDGFEYTNSETYTVKQFHPTTITLSNEEGDIRIPYVNLTLHFQLAWAITIHKIQGSTIAVPFNIYLANWANLNIIYTALSRATCIEHIHINRQLDSHRLKSHNFDHRVKVSVPRYEIKDGVVWEDPEFSRDHMNIFQEVDIRDPTNTTTDSLKDKMRTIMDI